MARPKKKATRRKSTRRRSKKSTRMSNRPIALFVIIVVLGMVGYAIAQNALAGDFVELDTIEVNGELLTLGANCLGMNGRISTERGEAIQLGLDKDLTNRPNVYDVFRDVTEQFDIKVESVHITKIENNNFLSVLTMSSGNKIFEADTRPSDAIALALRTDAPIYFNKTFLELEGEDICNQSTEE